MVHSKAHHRFRDLAARHVYDELTHPDAIAEAHLQIAKCIGMHLVDVLFTIAFSLRCVF